MIKNTAYYSKKCGGLAKGCKQCVKGRKLVLFVTGICGRNCWYCPISEQKMKKDVIYANEWKLKNEKDVSTLLKEAELCSSQGAGITGGDPFCKAERTAKYIELLKKRFGPDFHIHLYAPLNNITLEKAERLYDSGLDEIRIHPDYDIQKNWDRFDILLNFDWDIGMEIPVIPGYEKKIKKVIDEFGGKIKFLNLNELEISDTNMDSMMKKGFKPKSQFSYAVKGSEELSIKLMKYASKKFPKLNIHYCTTKLKDAVQLAKRLKLRAKNAANKFDKITSEGMLVRNCIYFNSLKPGVGYRRKLAKAKKSVYVNKLKKLQKNLSKIGIESIIDDVKFRLFVSKEDLKRIEGDVAKAIVEEYPTSDAMEVTVSFK